MDPNTVQPLLDWPTFTGVLILVVVLIGAALAAADRRNRRNGE